MFIGVLSCQTGRFLSTIFFSENVFHNNAFQCFTTTTPIRVSMCPVGGDRPVGSSTSPGVSNFCTQQRSRVYHVLWALSCRRIWFLILDDRLRKTQDLVSNTRCYLSSYQMTPSLVLGTLVPNNRYNNTQDAARSTSYAVTQ